MTANLDLIRGRNVVLFLTNKSGGAVALGDVVIIDTTNDTAFTTTTTAGYTGHVGVAQESIANNAAGRVQVQGYTSLINVSASVTRGDYAKTHTVAKQAVSVGSSRATGAFCQFLTGGTTPAAALFGIPDFSSSAAGGINSGSSFPGSPATNDPFFRTDRGLLYYYDGTRWVTMQLYTVTCYHSAAPNPVTTTGVAMALLAVSGTYNLWLVSGTLAAYVTTTNDGSKYWGAVFNKRAVNDSATTLVTISTQGNTPSTWVTADGAIGAVFDLSTHKAIQVDSLKTSTPGNMTYGLFLNYRLIG